MTDSIIHSRRFDVGRVIERTFGVLGANIGPFAVIALLIVAVPEGLAAWLQIGLMSDSLNAGEMMGPGYWGALALSTLVGLVCQALMQAAVIHASVEDLKGRKASLGESLGVAFRYALPLIGL